MGLPGGFFQREELPKKRKIQLPRQKRKETIGGRSESFRKVSYSRGAWQQRELFCTHQVQAKNELARRCISWGIRRCLFLFQRASPVSDYGKGMCKVKKLIFLFLFLLLVSCAKKPSGKIQGREIRLAYDKDNYPFTAEDGEGNPIGFEIELIKMISEKEGFSLKFLPKNQSALAPSVITGTSDMAMGGLLKEEEETRIQFSESYGMIKLGLLLSPYLFGEEGEDSADVFDKLRGETIMVKEGSLAAKLLEKQREEKGYFLKVVQSNEDFIQKAEEGEADAVAETLPVLEVLANKIVFSDGEKSFSKVGVRIYPIQEEEELCFIVSKGQNGEILRAFERGFRKLKEDGEYEALCERYGFSFTKTE